MAQDPLRRIGLLVALAAFAIGCEIAADGSPWWALLDLAVGLAVVAAEIRPLTLAFSLLWFVGTLVSGPYAVLTYRAPLLQLLLTVLRDRGPVTRAIVVVSWIAALLPFGAAKVATIGAAALVAAVLLERVRRVSADERGAAVGSGLAALALATTWTLAAAGVLPNRVDVALVDIVTLLAAAVPLAATSGLWSREAERALVVDLGPGRVRGLPLTRRLARALADPALELRYFLPGNGWVDEQGAPADAPRSGARVTRVTAPGGGEVALLHGPRAAPDSRLARAAASAAALALESTRLDAEVRARARDVADSRLRLLSAADDERRALERRLSEDVLVRLRRVDRLLAGQQLADERRDLHDAFEELVALGRGLYPPALAQNDPAGAFRELARRSPVPATVEIDGALDALPEAQRTAAWFLCSEALTNVARHVGRERSEARAPHARLCPRGASHGRRPRRREARARAARPRGPRRGARRPARADEPRAAGRPSCARCCRWVNRRAASARGGAVLPRAR